MKTLVLPLALLAMVAVGTNASAQHRHRHARRHVHVGVYARPYHFHPHFGAHWGSYHHPYYAPFYAPYAYHARDPYQVSGVRLKVKPNDAQVFVDDHYVGKVDDFDNVFQQLDLKPGRHKITAKRDGYRTFSMRVYAAPGRTMKIEQEMEAEGRGATP